MSAASRCSAAARCRAASTMTALAAAALAAVGVVHAGVGSDLSLLPNACKTLPTLAPAVLPRHMRGPGIGSVHDKRADARVRPYSTPTVLSVATVTARQICRHAEATQRVLSALVSAPPAATCSSGASSKMSSSVQQSPTDEARRCRLLRRMTRAHEIRRHRMHAMLWDERGEGLAALRQWP